MLTGHVADVILGVCGMPFLIKENGTMAYEELLEELGLREHRSAATEDNKDLGAWCGRRLTMGLVDDVNGPGAEECQEYDPSRFEIELLARHWAEVILDYEIDWFLYATSCSTSIRREPYAQRRLARIEELIGTDAIKQIFDQLREEARERLGDEEWQIFLNGDDEEWDRVRQKVQDFMSAQLAKEPEK